MDISNMTLCLKVLNECGENIPGFVSHHLDDLLPVAYSSLDGCCLLQRMDQLCAKLGALKRVVKLQVDVCEQLRPGAVEVNQCVTVLWCQSDVLAGAATLNAQGPRTASHFPLGNYFEELRGSQSKGDLARTQGAGGLAGSK